MLSAHDAQPRGFSIQTKFPNGAAPRSLSRCPKWEPLNKLELSHASESTNVH
jgi:hypothetical protein